ncbi:MAG: ClpXP protease specificity-enhancing factor [Betaproteobacteria bacterium]|nr:ClpXP protease specificity-enhancing factor [Betaproteobacteria bacterium]
MSESSDQGASSTKPYLLRALYEWCCDNGFTPYLAVKVDSSVRVPREHVRNGEIVLNISFGATSGLNMGNDDVRFKARFGGVARDILVPVSHITAIYARENGQGMAFPAPQVAADEQATDAPPAALTPAPAPETAAPAATPAAAPAPGPRLHSVPAATAETVPPAAPATADDEDEDDRPEPPPRSPGSHLKRVK